MSIGEKFATKNEVEVLRRKLQLALSGATIVQIESEETTEGVTSFIELSDCPASYAGATGELPSVNAAEDGLEFNPYVTVSPTAPILKLRNLTDAGTVDDIIQYAVGATPVAAEPANAYSGTYPLARPLWLNLNYRPGGELDPVRREFIRYVFSKQGQQDVVRDGYLPVGAKMARQALDLVGLGAGS